MRTTIRRCAVCAVVMGTLLVSTRAMADNNPFNWQSDAAGTPYVSSSNANSVFPTSNYTPMIYDVGSSELPSDAYDPTTGGKSRSNQPTIKHDFITGPETGQSNEFPIGEPWTLAFLAAAFAGFVALRRAKQVQQRS